MKIKGNILLKHSAWESWRDYLLGPINKNIGIFVRLVDIYIVACTIGITEDKIEEDDTDSATKIYATIDLTTYYSNENLLRIITFLYQNAVLNTRTLKYNDEKRKQLAFDDKFEMNNFSPILFLNKFANYGIKKLNEQKGASDFITINNINKMLKKMEEDLDFDIDDILNEFSN